MLALMIVCDVLVTHPHIYSTIMYVRTCFLWKLAISCVTNFQFLGEKVHPSLTNNIDKVCATMNKEDRKD